MAHQKGERTLEMRGDRERLSARSPHVEALLSGLALDPECITIARCACKNLWVWRNEYDVRRRVGGLFVPDRRLDKCGAERLLRSMLADLAIGGGE